MAVDDVPCNALNTVGPDYRSGCHSRHGYQRKLGYIGRDGYTEDGRVNWVWVPDVLSEHCRQTLFAELPFCEGCTREKDVEYLEKWK